MLDGKRFIPAGAGNARGQPCLPINGSVHPRWRGERGHAAPPRDVDHGSSPLARGTRPTALGGNTAERFIPAGAGNAPPPSALGCRRAVHPRWRGERFVARIARIALAGSSPLARGTLRSSGRLHRRCRFIPAGAGNAMPRHNHGNATAVHPRWRGERGASPGAGQRAIGSSPLARGTPVGREHGALCPRFIPAGAGNAASRDLRPIIAAVHPRWRGERLIPSAFGNRVHGSSPLARGTRAAGGGKSWALRFIPAGAGNASRTSETLSQWLVHPRWRGERLLDDDETPNENGSSPLARGTPTGGPTAGGGVRFIPAGAGNAFIGCEVTRSHLVHPRWRGERSHRYSVSEGCHGSSPLARGTPSLVEIDPSKWRFIPAGAGNASAMTAR